MSAVQKHWDSVKSQIKDTIPYKKSTTIKILVNEDRYKRYLGKARNRTLIKEDLRLYASVMFHTQNLEAILKAQKSHYQGWNFSNRIKFLVHYNCNIEHLKCECGRKYNWTNYCRQCPSPKKTWIGRSHTEETKKKQRLSTLSYLRSCKGQLAPRYNKDSISIIEEYGKNHGYSFLHAENGGEYFVKELGYFLDGYDPVNNVALEIDEQHHFDGSGNLTKRDQVRQQQIQELLGCKFFRVGFPR